LVTASLVRSSDAQARRVWSLNAREWAAVGALWALGARPPLALTAAVALLACGWWRVVVAAAGLTVATTLLLQPWLGSAWLGDWLAMLFGYHRGGEAAFAWSFVPERMSTLRAVLAVDFGIGDALASWISTGAWIAALGWLGLRARYGFAAAQQPRVWAWALLSYLSFCPHVTATEVLQVSVPLTLLAGARPPAGLTRGAAIGLLALPYLSPAVGLLAGLRWPQLLLMLTLALILRPHRDDTV
jgi:hypothetical protein